MKKTLLSILVLTSVIVFQSCSEDFNVAAPYKPVTIVYGMLNMKDTAHYIRIQKSFLDEKKNAFDMAKVSDSNFYKESDIEVMIKEMNGNIMVGLPVTLKRVDMDVEGYPKNQGIFFTSPNYAYKFKAALNPAHTYRMVINNKATNVVDSAEIKIVDSNRLALTGGSEALRMIKFANSAPGQFFSMFLDPQVIGNAYYIEGSIQFKWVEKTVNDNSLRRDSADLIFATLAGDEIKSLKLQTENYKIQDFLAAEMGAAPVGVERYLDSCNITIYGSGKELYDYITTLQIQSSGLTTDQIKPLYTNIIGKDVFGLYTSRTSQTAYHVYIDPLTIEALKTNSNTASLNIKGAYKR